MADSAETRALPPGYPAYLGYADGQWPTAARLPQLFPGAHVLSLTVTGRTLDADGIDCEPGNVNAVKAATWVKVKLATEAGSRPAVYADLESPGYSMTEVIAALDGLGVARSQYRVLTAHYDGEHVCSPARGCRDKDGHVITFTADGTQWTDAFRAPNGVVDMSLLADDFFGTPTPPATVNWTEIIMKALPLVRQGGTDVQAVRTVQGLLCARGHAVTVDGAFGAATLKALQDFQQMRGLAVDGVAGPVTWQALLGVRA